jgi:hypothetical protein
VRSYDWFMQRIQKANIKRAKFDRYRCEICYLGLSATSKKAKGEKISVEEEEQIRKYTQHTSLVKTQSDLFAHQKKCLDINTALIVMDYTTIHEATKFKLKDLNFTLYFKDQHDRLCHQFYDYWSKVSKKY